MACTQARQAALQLLFSLDTVQMGIRLHLGDVSYGNIGAPGRLDFTVIGPDVNLAARVESQTNSFNTPILATAAVAKHGHWTKKATVPLKGIGTPIDLFIPQQNK